MFELGAVPKRANVVDLEKMLQHEHLLAEIGVDTLENGPSEVWVAGIPVYRYRYNGIPVQAPPMSVYTQLRSTSGWRGKTMISRSRGMMRQLSFRAAARGSETWVANKDLG